MPTNKIYHNKPTNSYHPPAPRTPPLKRTRLSPPGNRHPTTHSRQPPKSSFRHLPPYRRSHHQRQQHPKTHPIPPGQLVKYQLFRHVGHQTLNSTKRPGRTQRVRQSTNIPTSHHHIVPTTHHQCHIIPHTTNLRHLHGHHNMATHHLKRVPRPNPTPSTFPPNHDIQHTPQLPLYYSHHEQQHILLLRLPQSPATPGH